MEQGLVGTKSVAIYCRVSTEDQSCERQERDLLAYAARAGFTVVGVWKEKASGVKANRRERDKVLMLAQRRKIDLILVTELTRWGRSSSDLINSLYQLASWNVSLIAQTGFQCDLTTPHGRLVAGVLASIAEFERDLIAERVRSGLSAARAKGIPLGRRHGQKVVTHKITSEILTLVAEGESYRTIASKLKCSKSTVVAVIKEARAKEEAIRALQEIDTEE